MFDWVKRWFGKECSPKMRSCVAQAKWDAAILELQKNPDKTIRFTVNGGRHLYAHKFIRGNRQEIVWLSRNRGEQKTIRKGIVDIEVIDRELVGTVTAVKGSGHTNAPYGFIKSEECDDYHFQIKNVVDQTLKDELLRGAIGQTVSFRVCERTGKYPSVSVLGRVERQALDNVGVAHMRVDGIGCVSAWYPDRGYGFIVDRQDTCRTFFFDKLSIRDAALASRLFDGIIGQVVDYEVTDNDKSKKYPRVAIAFAREALKMPSGDTEYDIAKRASLEGNVAAAIVGYKHILENPHGDDFTRALKDLAELYNRDKPEKAIELLEKYRSSVSSEISAQLDRMKLIYLLHAERNSDAIEWARHLLEQPGNPENRIKHYQSIISKLEHDSSESGNNVSYKRLPSLCRRLFDRRQRENVIDHDGGMTDAFDADSQSKEEILAAIDDCQMDFRNRGFDTRFYISEDYNEKILDWITKLLPIEMGLGDNSRVFAGHIQEYFYRKALRFLMLDAKAEIVVSGIVYLMLLSRCSPQDSWYQDLVRLVLLSLVRGYDPQDIKAILLLDEVRMRSMIDARSAALSEEQRLQYEYLNRMREDYAGRIFLDPEDGDTDLDKVDQLCGTADSMIGLSWLKVVRDFTKPKASLVNVGLDSKAAYVSFGDLLMRAEEFLCHIDYSTRERALAEFTNGYRNFLERYVDNDEGATISAVDLYYPILARIHDVLNSTLDAIIESQIEFMVTHKSGSSYEIHDGNFCLSLVLESVSRTAPTITSIRCQALCADKVLEVFSDYDYKLRAGESVELEKEIKVHELFDLESGDLISAKDMDLARDLIIRIWYGLKNDSKQRHFDCATIISLNRPGTQWIPIANPYKYWSGGRSCAGEHSEECFVGRDDVLNEMDEVFSDTTGGQCFVLYGQRRVGKTSLYENLKRRLGDERFVYVQIPAHTAFECGQDYRTKFRDRLYADSNIRKLIPELTFDKDADVDVSIANLVERIRAQGKVLVVGMDEFTSIYEDFLDQKKGGTDEQSVRLRIMKFLQLLKQNLDAGMYHLLLLGRPSMEQFKAEFGVELTAMDNMRQFWGLDDAAVRKLVYDKLQRDGVSLFRDNESYESFCRLVGGSPYLIHKVCSFLVDYLNRNCYPAIGKAQLDFVCHNLCRVGLRQLSIGEFKQWYDFKREDISDVGMLRFELHAAQCIVQKGISDESGIIGQDPCYAVAFNIARKWRVLEPVSQGSKHYDFSVGLFKEWLLENQATIEG